MRQKLTVLCAIGVVALCVLLFRLDSPQFVQADEALYGRHIAQGRAAGVLLYPAEADGSYMSKGGFAKPPLSIWGGIASKELFGETLFALRLPFALGTWWTVMALCAYCLFEIRKRGTAKALVCAALMLGAEGTLLYGRQASLEPMLTGFCLTTVLLYAAALNRHRTEKQRWMLIVGAGLFFLLAIMAKQIVGLLLPLPVIIALEWSGRRPGRWARGLLWFALGVVPFGIWFLVTYLIAGDGVVRDLFSFTVMAVEGFNTLTHENYLNRTVHFFAENIAPLSWWVSTVAAFFLFGVWTERAGFAEAMRRSAVFGYAAAAAGLFLLGGSGMPWYPYHLLPAAALASALLLVDGSALALFSDGWRQRRGILVVGLAFMVLLSLAQGAALTIVPQLTLVAVLLLLGLDVFLHRRVVGLVVALCLTGLVFVWSRGRHPTFWDRPVGLPALMATAHAAPCVRYDAAFKLRYSVERTQLGLSAKAVPATGLWDAGPCSSIGKGAMPVGTTVPGAHIEHAAGVFAVIPAVRPIAPPGPQRRYLPAHLGAGAEAEHDADGAVALKKRVRLHRKGEHVIVVNGALLLAPPGPATLTVHYRCDEAWAKRQPHQVRLSGVTKGGTKKNLRCTEAQLGEALSVSFSIEVGEQNPHLKVTTARGGIVVTGVAIAPR